MSERHEPVPPTAMVLVRRGLLALTVIGIVATAFELATERHWNGLEQQIPWPALVVITTATALLLPPDDRGTSAARILAVIVLGAVARQREASCAVMEPHEVRIRVGLAACRPDGATMRLFAGCARR